MSSEKTPDITPILNGPYLVKNLTRLSNQKGAIDTQETMALCRCGGSENKPFCDGSHWYNGFKDEKN